MFLWRPSGMHGSLHMDKIRNWIFGSRMVAIQRNREPAWQPVFSMLSYSTKAPKD